MLACQSTKSEKESPKSGDAQAKAEPKPAAKTAYEKRWEERPFHEVVSSCYNCHETLARQFGRPARDHITSAHFRASVTCNECHGGDPTKDDTEGAHNKEMGFIGKLKPEGMIERCGKCHQHEVKLFTASKHFPDHDGVEKVTCVQCHGSHDIGARPEAFKWSAQCAKCHALDQVPDLPTELVAMTDSKDALHASLRKLRYKLNNQPFPPEIMDSYREVRQLSADVIHATKAQGIKETMDQIIAKNKALAEKIEAAAR
ncbi:cytochrome c3 family protein [Candidatus Sumerlaeota bacterium]|nr:cytochrome c3 family protein [Candidatus Sumerlaeota bacterium]